MTTIEEASFPSVATVLNCESLRRIDVFGKNRLRSKSRLLDSRPHFGPPSGGLLFFAFGFTSTIA